MNKIVPLIERLLRNITIDAITDCWIWQGGINNIGYGMIRDGKTMRTTHRVSYEEHHCTKVPDDLCVMHTKQCTDPRCVNPDHLWVGTRKDRSELMVARGNSHNKRRRSGPLPRKICEVCGTDCAINAYTKYHGPNCRGPYKSINRLCSTQQPSSSP